MNTFSIVVKRNTKLFFKDKGMFFTALVTPLILLVLYATFLGNVYEDTFRAIIPPRIKVDDSLIDGCVAGQLISSILAVSCITVAFCSNMLMVQDKANSTVDDLYITPVNKKTLALGYYISTLLSTFIICFTAATLCLVYVGFKGFYMSLSDIVLLFLDVVLLVMFGTALSSVINFFLSTQGQISAVGSIISSVYGFICGAYMPISQFSDGLQRILSFLPGTYATSLVRYHSMRGVLAEMMNAGVPAELVEGIEDTVDSNMYFFDNLVSVGAKYAVLGGAVLLLIAVYVMLNFKTKNKKG